MADPFAVATGTLTILSAAISTCSALLQYYDTWKESRKHVASMHKSLDGLHKIMVIIQNKVANNPFDPTTIARVAESIKDCEEGVSALKRRLEKITGLQSTATRPTSAKSSKWTEKVLSIELKLLFRDSVVWRLLSLLTSGYS